MNVTVDIPLRIRCPVIYIALVDKIWPKLHGRRIDSLLKFQRIMFGKLIVVFKRNYISQKLLGHDNQCGIAP